MKINQIPYVIFQATSQFSFKFCITFQCHDIKFLWNFLAELLCFGQKEPIRVQILRLLCALMKVNQIPHSLIETKRSALIQILHHWSVSRKITPLCFLAQTFILWAKSNFYNGWVKIHQILMSCLKLQVSFSLNFTSLFSVTKELSCTFLAETVYDLDKASPSKCKISDFRLLMQNFIKFVLW